MEANQFFSAFNLCYHVHLPGTIEVAPTVSPDLKSEVACVFHYFVVFNIIISQTSAPGTQYEALPISAPKLR